ncbi:MAG: Glu-tRNA(Gln) amidotransferase subunit GatE [Methanobacteriaceae archaeon]|nr:Glu-tRNA(Gln) amidotransferase subunit GatE [Methanobacteriaceae archaeon]
MTEDKFDYKKLGLKMGLEIHQQLNTKTKLFCRCPNTLLDIDSDKKIHRRLRPTQSELGEIDRAAFEEAQRDLKFSYETFNHHTCLVEADEEPPAELNQEAVNISVILALLMNMTVVDEFHTMRKQVIDGSNTGGFQRTGMLATDGELKTEYGDVNIETLGLEEDSARRITDYSDGTLFRLDRLGIPLAEITTSPDMHHPLQVKNIAYQIGQILRSTNVKRGIGTIRQDLNISIKEGSRIEVKGVQDIDLIPTLVENEVQRQINLIEISNTLNERKAKVEKCIYDVSPLLKDSKSKIIQDALNDKIGAVLAIKLKRFEGMIGKEIQPGKRLGTEFAEHAKKIGVSGIFHTDELPAYGITQEEVDIIRTDLLMEDGDSFILVASQKHIAHKALQEVVKRAKQSLQKVPEETRKATEDGNTTYLRPLPTASRMYVETDIPTKIIDHEKVKEISENLPELPNAKKERIQKEYKINEELAEQLVQQNKADKFEEIKNKIPSIDATKIASDIIYTIKDLKRDGQDVTKLDTSILIDIYKLVDNKTIPPAETETLLKDACNNITPLKSVKKHNLQMLSDDEIKSTIQDIVKENKDMIISRKMGAMGPLMGKAMAQFKGNADGKLVSKIIKEEIMKLI